MAVSKEKIKEIYELLPKLSCGFRGFGSCCQFARAVAEGRASPFGCRQNPWSGYRIYEIVGMKVPAYSYGFQPPFLSPLAVRPSPQALKEQVRTLSQNIENILGRLEKLKARR